MSTQKEPKVIDWQVEFSRLNDTAMNIDKLELELNTAKDQEVMVRREFRIAMARTNQLQVEIRKQRHAIGWNSGLHMIDRTVTIINGRAVAKDMSSKLASSHNYEADETVLDGTQGIVFDIVNLSRVDALNRQGIGLILRIGNQLYLIAPSECTLEVGGHVRPF